MRPVTDFTFTIGANITYRLPCSGSGFKILAATAGVEVRGDWGRISQCSIGQGLTGTEFGYLIFTNNTGANNTLRVLVGDAGFIDNITGTVAVTSTVQATTSLFAPASATVGVAAVQLLPANASRKALIIQNNHGSTNLFVGGSNAVTTGSGLRVIPGGNWEPGTVPTGAIWGICDAAGNASIIVSEG